MTKQNKLVQEIRLMAYENKLYERDDELVITENIAYDAIAVGSEGWERRVVTFRKVTHNPEAKDYEVPYDLSGLYWMTEEAFDAAYTLKPRAATKVDIYAILHQHIGKATAHHLANQIEARMEAAKVMEDEKTK